ncbi:MAG: MBL fold metallo-hydrolase [Coriobacteriia bacterium]|nr:MBL fold metallo-hydrolase [Coriobacteriia bacterium]
MDAPLPVTLTIVYDNNSPAADTGPTDPPLRSGWGFACLVERGDTAVLFDTGGDGSVLMANFAALGIDPAEIDVLVLSHYHSDHTGGLDALLDAGSRPTVFVPASFPLAFRQQLAAHTEVVEVVGSAELLPGVHTTGEMGSAIIEQSLVIETPEGLVVVTGCAHPGIVDIVRRAAESGEVALVIGGFHLKDAGAATIDDVITDLQALGVARVAPTHCSGDRARGRFTEAFDDGFVLVGVGSVLSVGR